MIELRDIVLPLAHFTLDVSIVMRAHSTAIFGPSGAGKTSLLEVIAGLRTPTRGRVMLGERDVTGLPPRERRVGYVPQDDALFPHLSVRSNILYGGRDDLQRLVDVLEIGNVLDRGVKHLSGGERKRVALARALVTRPDVLLLDEPLAGVDIELRNRVLDYLVRVREEFSMPLVYVTHHADEAALICDEVVRIEHGRVV